MRSTTSNVNNGIRSGVLLLLGAVFLITGCAAGPDYTPPEMEMPQQWPQDSEFSTVTDQNSNQRWWKIFSDEELDKLIERAAQNNRDVRAAVYRVEASRALRDATSGQYYPTIDATGSYTRSLLRALQFPAAEEPINIYSTGLDFLWEIDLFGRIKRSVESSEASYQASIEDCRDVMVTLLADVCSNYIDLRTVQARIEYLNSNIRIQTRTLELTRNLYQAQMVGELDVRQAELNLADTKSQLPTLLISEEASLNALSVLIGQLPGGLKSELGSGELPAAAKGGIETGLPVDLLRLRPDIRRAERRLAAQTARIGIAKADLYPALQLSGSFNIESTEFRGLGNINNKGYAFGPGLRWNIFDGNRIRNTVRVEEATTAELLADWENTVLSAVEDVRNAMYAYVREKERNSSLEDSVKAALRAVELVESLYKSGLTDFQNVLDTQRTLFVQQDKLASSNGSMLRDLVQIYKAFGAGWQSAPAVDTREDAQKDAE